MSKIPLNQLGFTELETDLYLALLTQGEMTGYAVAKQINKAVANVYKGLESLTQKGAVIQTHQDKKIYCAVPWRQLLDSEQRKFSQTIEALAEQLDALPEPDENEQVYQLSNLDQVRSETLAFIHRAQHLILADIEPDALMYFAEALQQAADRGVEVRLKVYEQVSLPGVMLTLRQNGTEVYARTDTIRFKLSADGRHFVTALLHSNKKDLIQAFKSSSALMNMNIFSGLAYELILTELKQALSQSNQELAQQILQNTAHLHPFTTQNQVFQHYRQQYQQRYNTKPLTDDQEPS
ncbi:MAG: TrmB family transcriptional regulator [Pararheinheimera sp.]|jgi:sugar-specific transcriptional regulator TrmB|nr:TrmB family transcriptional regulator [Rheinheimera sp.]